MGFITKLWKNRVSEFPTRRVVTDTTTSESQTVYVARSEGTVTEDGDAFSAENMNDLEQRIATADALKADKDLGNVTGTLGTANGGTGQTTLQATRNAMGLGNTTGALPIANGGTGATTRLDAVKNLSAEGVSSPNYFIGLTTNWAKYGYTSVQEARNAMGLGNTTGALPIANGGTGQTTAALARNALGLGNTTGALPIANGGTGQTTAALARNALGLGNTTGALPIANGGTGSTTAANARTALGCGNGAVYNIYMEVGHLVTSQTSWQVDSYGGSFHGNKKCVAALVCPAGRWQGSEGFYCWAEITDNGTTVKVHYKSNQDWMGMGYTLLMIC